MAKQTLTLNAKEIRALVTLLQYSIAYEESLIDVFKPGSAEPVIKVCEANIKRAKQIQDRCRAALKPPSTPGESLKGEYDKEKA